MNTVLDRLPRFKMPSILMPWSSSSSITSFSTGTLKIKLEKSEKLISANVEYCIILVYFCILDLLAVKASVRKVNQCTACYIYWLIHFKEYRHRHVLLFLWQSLEILSVFNTLTLKQIFLKTTSMKIVYFSRLHPDSISIYVQNFSTLKTSNFKEASRTFSNKQWNNKSKTEIKTKAR